EADHRHPPTWLQQLDCRVEPGFERAELVVDRDSQRLECASGGMDATARRPQCRRDCCYQLVASSEGPSAEDLAGDAPSARLLAILTQDAFEVRLRQPVEQISGGWLVCLGIEAHVERLVEPKRKAAAAGLQLHG